MPRTYNMRSMRTYSDYVEICHTNGSIVWADENENGLWYVWLTEGFGKGRLPVGVYVYPEMIDVLLAISDALM